MILDEQGKPVDIRPYDRNAATKIIEDFMLIANETVAEDYFWQEVPFLYRTHDNPDPDRMRKLATFINNFGYSIRLKDDEVHPKELQKLLAKLDGTPEEDLISRLTLRSMKRARYTTDCTDILDWQPSITATLLRLSAGIRIFRFTGSSRTVSADG